MTFYDLLPIASTQHFSQKKFFFMRSCRNMMFHSFQLIHDRRQADEEEDDDDDKIHTH